MSAQCRVQADGGTVRSAVVVGSEMRRRRVAGSSALCGVAPWQPEEQADGLLELCDEYRSAPWCCGDVRFHNDVTAFGIVATILLL